MCLTIEGRAPGRSWSFFVGPSFLGWGEGGLDGDRVVQHAVARVMLGTTPAVACLGILCREVVALCATIIVT